LEARQTIQSGAEEIDIIVGRPDKMGVNAAEGIPTLVNVLKMIEAVTIRLGTSFGVELSKKLRQVMDERH
jgi:deoxyribose-phosphate aldolase